MNGSDVKVITHMITANGSPFNGQIKLGKIHVDDQLRTIIGYYEGLAPTSTDVFLRRQAYSTDGTYTSVYQLGFGSNPNPVIMHIPMSWYISK